MAKRTSSKKKSSLLQQVLLVLGTLLLAAVAYALGLTGTEETTDTPATSTSTEVSGSPTAGSWYELYFTQPINSNDESRHHGAVLEQALIRRIDAAQRTIDAALFEIDAPDTTAALVRAAQRGVKIRLVLDNEHALEDPGTTVQEIIDAGATFVSDERSALMHNKYVIIDGTYVWTGATNLTRNGIYNNNNNAILIRSQQLVANYQTNFEEMFTDKAYSARDYNAAIPNRTFTLDGTRIETYFSAEDGDAIEARILELINASKTSVRVMAFSFTTEPLGTALIQKMQQGLTIQGLFETTGSLQGQMGPLGCASNPIGSNVRQDTNPSIMHHKVFIFDEQIVALGSFNFSNNAKNNSENFLVIHNPEIARAYLAEFQKLYAQGRQPANADLSC